MRSREVHSAININDHVVADVFADEADSTIKALDTIMGLRLRSGRISPTIMDRQRNTRIHGSRKYKAKAIGEIRFSLWTPQDSLYPIGVNSYPPAQLLYRGGDTNTYPLHNAGFALDIGSPYTDESGSLTRHKMTYNGFGEYSPVEDLDSLRAFFEEFREVARMLAMQVANK